MKIRLLGRQREKKWFFGQLDDSWQWQVKFLAFHRINWDFSSIMMNTQQSKWNEEKSFNIQSHLSSYFTTVLVDSLAISMSFLPEQQQWEKFVGGETFFSSSLTFGMWDHFLLSEFSTISPKKMMMDTFKICFTAIRERQIYLLLPGYQSGLAGLIGILDHPKEGDDFGEKWFSVMPSFHVRVLFSFLARRRNCFQICCLSETNFRFSSLIFR